MYFKVVGDIEFHGFGGERGLTVVGNGQYRCKRQEVTRSGLNYDDIYEYLEDAAELMMHH